jgi:mannose-6-phosphate isomerase-like protein (cupin superfamily)
MGFGNIFEDVLSKKNHPEKTETKYGWKVIAINEPEFSLKQFFLKKDFEGKVNINGGVVFLEKGSLKIKIDENSFELDSRKSIRIPKGKSYDVSVKEDSSIYLFSGSEDVDSDLIPKDNFGILDKYWGKIENIESNADFTGKRIFMKTNGQSSLEYHVHKKEGYIIQSGKLKVGVRVGRAENRSFVLTPGDTFVIDKGVMHMRIALEDTVIMEVSTKDDDADSHLVEDGQKYKHIDAE